MGTKDVFKILFLLYNHLLLTDLYVRRLLAETCYKFAASKIMNSRSF